MRNNWLLICVCSLLTATNAFALTIDAPLADNDQEARAKTLFHELRCVVCQSESVADSQAEVARDMRRLVRAKIAQGETDQTIKSYLVSRYGNVILMTPPLFALTYLLWFGPLLVLLIGIILAKRLFKPPPL